MTFPNTRLSSIYGISDSSSWEITLLKLKWFYGNVRINWLIHRFFRNGFYSRYSLLAPLLAFGFLPTSQHPCHFFSFWLISLLEWETTNFWPRGLWLSPLKNLLSKLLLYTNSRKWGSLTMMGTIFFYIYQFTNNCAIGVCVFVSHPRRVPLYVVRALLSTESFMWECVPLPWLGGLSPVLAIINKSSF